MTQQEGGPIDFDGLAAALLERAETLVSQWLPNGVRRGHHWYVGDFDGAKGKSANVNLTTGTWIDNGRPEDKGGDLTSLYRRVMHLPSQAHAARELMRDQGWRSAPPPANSPKRVAAVWLPIHPVPDDAPAYRTQWGHYARGIPQAHWEYRNAAGELLGVVCRFNKADGTKEVQPLSFCAGPNGARMWRYKAFAEPRPLYGLDRLARFAASPEVSAIVVEGEGKADKLWHALGETMPVLGWPGGCKVPHLADWAALAGRRVVCWPDADAQLDKATGAFLPAQAQPGMVAMRKVQQLLGAMGCRVSICL